MPWVALDGGLLLCIDADYADGVTRRWLSNRLSLFRTQTMRPK
jgi:hypothetical protein